MTRKEQYLLTILILFSLCNSCKSQSIINKDRRFHYKLDEVNGNFKSVQVIATNNKTDYTYNRLFVLDSHLNTLTEFNGEFIISVCYYDTNNRIDSVCRFFNPNNKISLLTLKKTSKWTRIYYKTKFHDEFEEFSFSDGVLDYKKRFEFDTIENKSFEYLNDSIIQINLYDFQGRIIESKIQSLTLFYEYNSNGDIEKRYRKASETSAKKLIAVYSYKYDTKGNWTEREAKVFDKKKDGIIQTKRIFQY